MVYRSPAFAGTKNRSVSKKEKRTEAVEAHKRSISRQIHCQRNEQICLDTNEANLTLAGPYVTFSFTSGCSAVV